MPAASESREAMEVVTLRAVEDAQSLIGRTSGAPAARRAGLLELVPTVIGYYSEGTAALAVDFYEDERAAAGVRSRFVAQVSIADRTVKIRRGIAWASEPLFDGAEDAAAQRLGEVVQLETARPYRDTILDNRRRDPESVGWRRIPNPGACRFCRMLADKGAIFRESTARFASHENCLCTAQPVFGPNDTGETASVLQYVASKRRRTPAEKAALRDYLALYGES